MSYNLTVPERTDIGRPSEDVNVRIKGINIFLEANAVNIEVVRTNRNTFDAKEFVFHLEGDAFTQLAASVPSGSNLYEVVKNAAYDYLMTRKSELSFAGETPMLADGVTPEPVPSWVEV